MPHELTIDQQERLTVLDAVHRVLLGDENINAAAMIDVARYVVTGDRVPWAPSFFTAPELAMAIVAANSAPYIGVVNGQRDEP